MFIYIIYLYWFAGGVKAVRIPKEKGTGKSKGFAYVEFKNRISHGVSSDLHIDQSYCCFVQILLVVKSILIVFSQQKFTLQLIPIRFLERQSIHIFFVFSHSEFEKPAFYLISGIVRHKNISFVSNVKKVEYEIKVNKRRLIGILEENMNLLPV